VPHGNASTICCASHSAVGCRVTANQSSCRRQWPNTRNAKLERQGWNQAEIDRRDGVCMVVQECPPRLRWRPSVPGHVFRDRRLGDLEPELEQLTMDARGAPQWILLAHPLDEFAQLMANFGPLRPSARFSAPIGPKRGAMPAQDRVRLNDSGQTEQAWPEPSHQTINARSLPRSRRRRGAPLSAILSR
jgi:hypothetical protein